MKAKQRGLRKPDIQKSLLTKQQELLNSDPKNEHIKEFIIRFAMN